MKIRPVGAELFLEDIQMDRRSDMTKLTVAFLIQSIVMRYYILIHISQLGLLSETSCSRPKNIAFVKENNFGTTQTQLLQPQSW